MRTAFVRISDGTEVKAGDFVDTDNGRIQLSEIYTDIAYVTGGGTASLEFCRIKAIRYPSCWLMNRATGRPLVVGDVLADGRTVWCVGDDCDGIEFTDGTTHYCGNSRSDAIAGLDLYQRKSYSESPPEMPPHRRRAGVLQLRVNDRWVPTEHVRLWSFNGVRTYYNALTHVMYGGRVTSMDDLATTYFGAVLLKSETVDIVVGNETRCYPLRDCREIDGVLYHTSSLYFLVDSDEWVLELPDGYVELLGRHREYAHKDECCWCDVESGYALDDECGEWDGGMYTDVWLDNNTFVCDSCGERFPNEEYDGDGMCCSCGREAGDSRIRDYTSREANSYTPEKNVQIKFGIELEVEPKDYDDPTQSLDVFDRLLPSRYAVYKEDGSLADSGFEIVTRPDCPSVHKRIWSSALADPAVRRTTTSWKSGSCGIHIHVSRRPLSDLWVGRIVVLVHSSKMSKIVAAVAGRYNKSYCEIDGRKTLTAGKGTNCSRYAAVNTCHEKTIEFRIFRGTLHRESFLKNIEFVEAVLAYCKPAVTSNALVDDPASFLQFVKNWRKSYINLYEFLKQKGFYGEHVEITPEVIAERKALAIQKRTLLKLKQCGSVQLA